MFPLTVLANNPVKGKHKYEKTKKVKKEFTVNANALLDIDNKYGNIDVTTWNENRVVINVEIKVTGNDEDKVKDRLDMIDIDFNGSSNLVSARTIIEKKKSGWGWSWGSSSKVHYEINYTIKAPKSNKVDLNIDYGNISVNELDGKATLTCDYGNISAGDLNHANNQIDLDYGNANIDYMKGGDIVVDYSKVNVTEADKINLDADYTTTVFDKVTDVKYVCDYGSIKIYNAVNVVGDGDYLTTRLGTIAKNVSLVQDYGSVRIETLNSGFETVNLDGDYCSFKIGVPNSPFNFTLDLSYAGFRRGDNGYEFSKQIVKSSSKYYQGSYKGGSSANIKISSDYGSVTFNN